jgi:hypothetical protein
MQIVPAAGLKPSASHPSGHRNMPYSVSFPFLRAIQLPRFVQIDRDQEIDGALEHRVFLLLWLDLS